MNTDVKDKNQENRKQSNMTQKRFEGAREESEDAALRPGSGQ